MRNEIIVNLEKRMKKLEDKKKFNESIITKHIPNFLAFIETAMNNASEHMIKENIEIGEQISELKSLSDELCGCRI